MYRRNLVAIWVFVLVALSFGSSSARDNEVLEHVPVKFTVRDCGTSFLPGADLFIRHIRPLENEQEQEIATYSLTADASAQVDVTIFQTKAEDKIEVTITPPGSSPSGIHTYTYRYDSVQGKEDYVASIPTPLGPCYDMRNGDRIVIKYGAFHEE